MWNTLELEGGDNMMRFKGFKRAVKKVAKGRYHCVKQYLTEYNDGELRHGWGAYVDGASWTNDHNTPEEAVAELERMCENL